MMALTRRTPEELRTQLDFANHREKVTEALLSMARALGVSGVTELEEEHARAMRFTDGMYFAAHGRWPIRA